MFLTSLNRPLIVSTLLALVASCSSDEASTEIESAAEESAPVAEPEKAPDQTAQPPSWIEDPASYYDPPREDLVLAVGRSLAILPGPGAEKAAANQGRVALLRALGTARTLTSVQEEGDSTTVSSKIEGTLHDAKVLATWHGEHEVFALLSAPKAGQKKATIPKLLGAGEAPDQGTTKKPTWVEDPGSFYDPRQPDVVLVVGEARAFGSPRIVKMRAETDARAKLAAASKSAKKETDADTSPDSATVRTVTQAGVKSQVLAEWQSPEGIFYVLMR